MATVPCGALMLPLLSNSLDRATQVAEAMESRGYGNSVKRTFFREAPFALEDIAALVLLGCAAGLTVVVRLLGLEEYEYYPSLGDPSLAAAGWASLMGLSVLLLCPVILALLRQSRDLHPH